MAIVMVGLALRCFWSMELGWGVGWCFLFGLFLFLFPLMNSLPMHTSHYAFPRDFLHLDWRELDGDVCLLVGRPGLEGEVVGGLH